MSKEIIKLRVPAEPKAEFVSHGNLGVDLVPGSAIETPDRRFADWLIEHYELEEIGTEKVGDPDGDGAAEESENDLGYPADFPSRDALITAEVPYETAINLNAEQLAEYKGIGPKTADAIVAYVAEGGTE
ncbi:MAG: hypothetical protein ABI539_15140 [Acidobacteriota bacterium]